MKHLPLPAKLLAALAAAAVGIRQDASARDLTLQDLQSGSDVGEAMESEASQDLHASFITKEHFKITHDACDVFVREFHTDDLGRGRLLSTMSTRDYAKVLCEDFKLGTQSPDCPTYRDSFTLETACIEFPLVGHIPFHQGMFQMAMQTAAYYTSWLWWRSGALKLHTMDTFRSSEQHKHASPLLPINVDGRRIALITNQQLKMKMVEQSVQWYCKGAHALADGFRSYNTEKVQIGAFFLGKILHTVQDTFTLSHVDRDASDADLDEVERLTKEEHDTLRLANESVAKLLQRIPITKSYSMDDVTWSEHASLDKGVSFDDKGESRDEHISTRKASVMEDAAILASTQVMRSFAELVSAAASRGNVTEQDFHTSLHHLGAVLCHQVWIFKNPNAGAGGSSAQFGMNGERSNWNPEVADSDALKSKVREELRRQVSAIDKLREKGQLAMDPDIPFTYPSTDKDFCSLLDSGTLTCQDIGYTADMSASITVDSTPWYKLHMKAWFYLVCVLVICCLGSSFFCCCWGRRSTRQQGAEASLPGDAFLLSGSSHGRRRESGDSPCRG